MHLPVHLVAVDLRLKALFALPAVPENDTQLRPRAVWLI